MVGAGDCGWGHGHHWDRMDAEGDPRPQAPHPHPHRLQRLPQRRLLYIAPSHSSLSPVSGYVSIPSHPLGASASTETYLQTSARAIFCVCVPHPAPRTFQRPSNGKAQCLGERRHLVATAR